MIRLNHGPWTKYRVRALPDITSSPEVRQILEVRAVRKPDVFLTGPDTLISRKICFFHFFFFLKFFFSIFMFPDWICLSIFYTKYVYWELILWEVISPVKCLRNRSPDSVRSANLGVRSCPVRKLICPVRSSPTTLLPFDKIDWRLAFLSKCNIS